MLHAFRKIETLPKTCTVPATASNLHYFCSKRPKHAPMYLKTLAVLLISHAPLLVSAQEDDWRIYKPGQSKEEGVNRSKNGTNKKNTAPARSDRPQTARGAVTVHADKKILLLDSLKKEKPSALEGYRLQLFFGGRSEAQALRGEFLKMHPETGAYISYLAPNFRLRVGDFRTKAECEALKTEIQSDFPGSYIVRDEISLPPLRREDAEEN